MTIRSHAVRNAGEAEDACDSNRWANKEPKGGELLLRRVSMRHEPGTAEQLKDEGDELRRLGLLQRNGHVLGVDSGLMPQSMAFMMSQFSDSSVMNERLVKLSNG